MKKSILLYLVLMQITGIVIPAAHAQKESKIVALDPMIGTVLDRTERDLYGFFPDVAHFQSAVFFLLPDSSYQVQINFIETGQLQSRVLKLTRREFLKNYFEVVERNRPARTFHQALLRSPEVELIWKNGSRQKARLLKMQGDTLQLHIAADSTFTNRYKALQNLSQINLVRHASVKKLFTYALIGGAAGVLIGLASGDDPPGWFSMTAEEKALLLGGSLFSATVYFGGSMQIIHATDIDIALDKMNMEEKQKVIQSILDGKYRSAHSIALTASGGYLKYDDGPSAPFYQFSLLMQYKPRLWFGLNYSLSNWNRWHETKNFRSEYESHLSREKRRFSYFSFEIRALLSPYGIFHPYFEWGFLIGRKSSRIYIKDSYAGPPPSTYESEYPENGTGPGIPFGVGTLIPLNRFLKIDVGVKRILAPHTPWQLRLGMQFRLR